VIPIAQAQAQRQVSEREAPPTPTSSGRGLRGEEITTSQENEQIAITFTSLHGMFTDAFRSRDS